MLVIIFIILKYFFNFLTSTKMHKYRILVIDFGSQYTQLLLRKIRELGVYSELFTWNIDISQIHKFNPNGIILAGGPHSVTERHAPNLLTCIFQLGIPILGICYGMQIMAIQLGGHVRSEIIQREFGGAQITILSKSELIDNIYDRIDINGNMILDVWMSHGDVVTTVPPNFVIVGVTENCQVAMMANEQNNLYGVQFHPEVTHTKKGKDILKRFILDICSCQSCWNSVNITNNIIVNIRSIVGNDRVALAFSGGTDSLVTALLLQRAIGNKCICIFIDNGLLQHYACNQFHDFYSKYCNLNILYVAEEERFFNALVGIVDPEEKRKIIGKIFVEIFEEQITDLEDIKWLAQGTIYSDIIESGFSCVSHKNIIKSHHNVGGFSKIVNVNLLEPIKYLFKDEVRNIALTLGLPMDIVYRYPFPGPGLAIRILGEVKKEYCTILRKADVILYEELKKEHLYSNISQAFSIFLPIYSVGIQGDCRVYKKVIALRAVETVDFMTARWARLSYDFLDKVSNRIINEVDEVSRVVYDISCKPPATIEWE